MEITVMMTPGKLQFNLSPETPHERELLSVMKKYDGEVRMNEGLPLCETVGQYIRQSSSMHSDTLSITIDRDKPEREAPGE